MRRLRANENGIARIVAILIILLILTGLGFGGWWLWQRNAPQRIEDRPAGSPQTEQPAAEAEPPVQTVEAEPASGAFSVRVPRGWQQQQCPADNPDILFAAPEADLLGRCASEFFGLVAISRAEGDRREDESAYSRRGDINTISYDKLSLAGMEAVRVEYVQTEEPIVGPPAGSRFIEVVAFDGTYSYTLTYTQQPGWDDYRPEFDAIVGTLSLEPISEPTSVLPSGFKESLPV